nr:hypothetical protein GCM10020185_46300 [Pseudomonas brassicacearum subsp. brassicacearum]
MTAIGEESGALDDMLDKVASFYEAEVDNLVDNLTSLMEPFIMVVLGGGRRWPGSCHVPAHLSTRLCDLTCP